MTLCEICGDPFIHQEISSHLCGKCLIDRPYFEWARSVFEWGAPLSDVVHRLKYQGSEVGLRWMVRKMAESLDEMGPNVSFDYLVPVPLHTVRLIRRGFNQALLLSRGLHREKGIPLEFENLKRRRYEKPQSLGDREERLKQIRGAFAVKHPKVFEEKNVLLIDDVFTTGATLNECAKVLQKSGAKVYALTLARTLLHSKGKS
jgi:ComF family protein